MKGQFFASQPLDKYGNIPYKESQVLEKLILWISVATVLVLSQLPYQKIDGNPVPTIIFKNRPSSFHAFILSLNFSFFGSFMTGPLRRRYPRLARCCLLLAVVSMTVGVAILAWLMVPLFFELGERLCVSKLAF
ncbi:hypothetical protein TIFTF001_008151 [Ficus carica]|uniref:Uncharacterized protein n=1 Tax=Ficus carica TaxID=3494 RepID=A0AA87ZMI1_FICCA|nr:hypothetical protein TIFTF001_008151 [Ficus carica]